jgi:flagellar basal body-associated protein FliL
MPFCNSCGSSLDSGVKFCAKCGAANPAAAGAPATPAATPVATTPPAKSGSALKIILIIVAVIFGLGILGVGTMVYFVHRVVSRSHIEQKNGEVKVDTPFGSVESTNDPDEAAHNLGIDLYPGATVVKGTTANVAFGNTHSAAADFESTDSISTVADFYKSRFPHANVTSTDNDRLTIVATDNENLTTIIIEPKEGKTRIHIAKVTGKLAGHTTSN